jgi:hypothetical protein
MWNFSLSTLNEVSVISGIQEMARLNCGGFFIATGGRTKQALDRAGRWGAPTPIARKDLTA